MKNKEPYVDPELAGLALMIFAFLAGLALFAWASHP